MARIQLGQGLQQGLRQEMRLQPRMLQAIEVLQLPLTELATYLRSALQENEALRLEGEPAPALPTLGGRGDQEDAERHDAWLESQASGEKGLVEHLESQLVLLEVDAELLPWIRLVIANLDPTGCLTVSDEALLAAAAEEGLEEDAERLGRAIGAVQGLEPRGVGGRNTVEALLLQLDPEEEDYGLLCRLLEEFLGDVARNKLPAVARGLDVDVPRLNELLLRLRELDPAPGSALSDESPPPLRPEVIVESTERGFEVRIDQSGLPPLALDEDVQAMSRDRTQPAEVRRYVREKLERARWLVDALEQRKRTLQRIASWTFQEQRDFLEKGPGHLVPLSMGEVAAALGVHVSTVSRGVSGKYADTPFGIVPMRRFFQAPAGGRPGVVRGTVQEALAEIVADEDPAAPLSDDDLAAALAQRGFEVARRTVAKYRKELSIPSSYRRRRYT